MPPSPLLLSRLKLPRLDLVPESTLCVPDTGSSANINSQQNLFPGFLLLVATQQTSSQTIFMNGIIGWGKNQKQKKERNEKIERTWRYTPTMHCISFVQWIQV